MLFFFRVLQVQTQVQESLYFASRETACEAGAMDQTVALLTLAEGHFENELSKYDEVSAYVRGGKVTLSLLGSDVSDDYVKLQANYSMKIPVPFFSLDAISVTQSSESRKWTGDNAGDGTESEEEYVYVTETGTAYHKSRDCTSISLSIQSVDYSEVAAKVNSSGGKYYACSCASGVTSGTVYITSYGTKYHASMTCSALKRTVYVISISEVGSRTPCSKCAQ
ncbi:MAG: hypothetical protein LUI02_06255 [Clostridiales bacterium]|nr:hypothetical protein [Clostridiales bacterium]